MLATDTAVTGLAELEQLAPEHPPSDSELELFCNGLQASNHVLE